MPLRCRARPRALPRRCPPCRADAPRRRADAGGVAPSDDAFLAALLDLGSGDESAQPPSKRSRHDAGDGDDDAPAVITARGAAMPALAAR